MHWSLLRAILHHLKYTPNQAYGKMLLTWDKRLHWLEPSSVAKCKSWNFLPDYFLINTLLRANSQPLKRASETLWSLSLHTRLFGWWGQLPLVFLFKHLWDMLTNSLVISSRLSGGDRISPSKYRYDLFHVTPALWRACAGQVSYVLHHLDIPTNKDLECLFTYY